MQKGTVSDMAATRLQSYAELAADNAAFAISSYENWSAFLATAARLYKYSFPEQLCIWAQRPEATACADWSTWDKVNRFVRRYAKGIGVIRIVDGEVTLRYVFDVADTGPKAGAPYPFLWENKDEYQPVIRAALESRFHVACDGRGLAVQLATIAVKQAQRFWADNQEQITESAGDGWPLDCTGDAFVDAVAASVAYALLSRCGLHPETLFNASDFTNVSKFSGFSAVLALGTAVSRCSETVLRRIEGAIKQYERDKRAGGSTQEQPSAETTAAADERGPAAAAPVIEPEPDPSYDPGPDPSYDPEDVPPSGAPGEGPVPTPESDCSPEPAELPAEPEEAVQESFLPPEQAPAPEVPANRAAAASNFRITDDNLGAAGGPKARYAANIAAIRLLKQLEAERRSATPDEQEILSRYVGWGGVPDAFEPDKAEWATEYAELKDLLTGEEYASARASTLNSHYTSPIVIRAIYEALGNMGFTSGTILEPSCAVGNFFGCLPESMTKSRLYGVELDGISGRIAKHLYPEAHMIAAGYETTDRRDFYDIAVGNVPFGQYQVNDPAYNRYGFSIHNYFLCKTIDQLRPGGIMAFITSRYTMDSKDIPLSKGEYRIVPPKNGKGRVIAAADDVIQLLREQKRIQNEWRDQADELWQDDGYVFTDEFGRHLKTLTVYKNFKRIVASIGRPEVRFHDLRHSYALVAIRSGDDIKTVQGNLGHATAAFTLDVYGHVTDGMKQASANRMQKVIEGIKGNRKG